MSQLPLHNNSHLSPPPQRNSTDLPILEKSIEVYKLWHSFLPTLPKASRYTLGEKIDAKLLVFIEYILKATYAPKGEKSRPIVEASITLDIVKAFLKITWELKLLDNKKFAQLSEALVEIGKMLGGWQKHIYASEGGHP